ncbi:MAG TPA: hypothetical protein VMU93_02945 [Caulobacteraceae bacterium]|nr:hypothetical protein [Caulobacteraceae bacterium]
MYTLLPLLLLIGTLASGAFAIWKGDTAARVAGVLNLVNAVVLPLSRLLLITHTSEVLQLFGDFAWAIGLLLLAVRYASIWLGVTMLLQATQFSLHAYYLVMERRPDLLHAWINNLDTLGISICIVVGTALAIRRRVLFDREEAELQARRQRFAAHA